jgi:hypothetical protein
MREMVRKLIPWMKWRHHGIGVLQGYLNEEADPEIRIHIWSKKLLKAGIDLSGDIHDHRFEMISHVLCGTVAHEEIEPFEDLQGEWGMMKLTHARAASDTNYHGPTEELPERYGVLRNLMMITAGNSYSFPSRHFHRSPLFGELDDVAVTVIEKHRQQNYSARILYPLGSPPVMAFGHRMDEKLVDDVLAEAMKALQP